MLDRLRGMAVFAKTVETGSFRGAARALGLSPSVVSHHVAQLERQLDVLLLRRSTRKLTLTEEGRSLFEAAQAMMAAAEGGLNRLTATSRSPAGRINLACMGFLVSGPLMDDLAAFALAFPRVELSMSFSDAPVDLIGTGVDVAIRAGTLKDSSWKSKKLFEIPRKLIAAPAYASRQPNPETPRDVASWDWIQLKSRPPRVTFTGPRGEELEISFAARCTADSSDAMLQLALRGLGLAVVPALIADPALRAGRAVELLPRWRPWTPTAYAVWPANAPRSSLSARLVSFLEERGRTRERSRG
jgi:DNA-binding transcriptional LysR family regulator